MYVFLEVQAFAMSILNRLALCLTCSPNIAGRLLSPCHVVQLPVKFLFQRIHCAWRTQLYLSTSAAHCATTFQSLPGTRAPRLRETHKSYKWVNSQINFNFSIHGYVPLAVIDRMTSNMLRQKLMTEETACLLLSLCGKDCIDNSSMEKIKSARQIFNASEVKSVALYNDLLQVYIENFHTVSSTEVLQELKDLGAKPNQKTYTKLIAGHCLEGDMDGANQIVKYMNMSGMKIPLEVFGYLAFGLCVSGKPTDAIKLIDSLKKRNLKLSWSTVTWFCCGLARQGEIEALHKILQDFSASTTDKMLVTELFDIYKELSKSSNEQEINHIFTYAVPATDQDMLHLYEQIHVQDLKFPFIAFMLENSKHQQYSSHRLAKRVLEMAVRKQYQEGDMWKLIAQLKQVFPNFYPIENYMLQCLLKKGSEHWKSFLYTLTEKKSDLIPDELWPEGLENGSVSHKDVLDYCKENNISLNSKMLEFLTKAIEDNNGEKGVQRINLRYMTSYTELSEALENHSSKDVTAVIEDTLKQILVDSSSFSAEKYALILMNVLSKTDSIENISNKIFSALLVVLKNWFSKLKFNELESLLTTLKAQGFKINVEEFPDVFDDLDVEFHDVIEVVLSRISLKETTICRNLHSKYIFRYIRMNNIEGIKSSLKYITTLPDPMLKTILTEVMLDALFYLPPESFKIVLDEIKGLMSLLPTPILKLIFCRFVETNNVQEAEHFVMRFSEAADGMFQTIPSTVLNICDSNMLEFLTNHLVNTKGHADAMWIMYGSMLKAGRIDDAAKILGDNVNLDLSNDHFKNLLTSLTKSDELISKYPFILDHCKNQKSFKPMLLYEVVVKDLVKKERLEEAVAFLDSSAGITKKLRSFVCNAYLCKNELPLTFSNDMSKKEKQLTQLIYNEPVVKKKWSKNVLSQMKEVVGSGQKIEFSWLCTFFSRLPVDEYMTVKHSVQDIIVGFKPERQSVIIVNMILQLINNNFLMQALDFTKSCLEDINFDNLFVWELVISALCNAALEMQRKDAFVALNKFAPNNEMKSIVQSYIHLHMLVTGKQFQFCNISSLEMNNIVRILLHKKDEINYKKAFEIALDQYKNNPAPLKYFIAASIANDSDSEVTKKMLCDVNLGLQDMLEIAKTSINLATSFERLEKIDSIFRDHNSSNVIWHKFLNLYLFKKFYNLLGSGYVNESTLIYLHQCFHKVPTYLNYHTVTNIYMNVSSTLPYEDSDFVQRKMWKEVVLR